MEIFQWSYVSKVPLSPNQMIIGLVCLWGWSSQPVIPEQGEQKGNTHFLGCVSGTQYLSEFLKISVKTQMKELKNLLICVHIKSFKQISDALTPLYVWLVR